MRAIAALAVALAVTLVTAFAISAPIELPLRDAALRFLPQRPAAATAVVAIDEASLRALGRWPWSRERIAELIDRAVDADARAVVLDVLLAEGDAADVRLAAAMRRIPTITVAVLQERGEWLLPASELSGASTAAHGNFELDHDGILRRFASTKQSAERSLAALSVQAASLVTGAPIPVGVSLAPQFRTPPRAIPVFSAAEVLRGALPEVRGKVVFIGSTAMAMSDRVLTPVSHGVEDPGVTIHAAATESLIRGETIRDLPPIVSGLAAGLIALFMIDLERPRRRQLIIGTAVVLVVMAAGVALLARGIAAPFATLGVCAVAIAIGVEMKESRVSLEQIASRVAEQRARDVESKRVLAHELKTPIASMRGLTQLLSGYDLTDAERRRVATLLDTEARKLQSMVGGLLDLERLPLRDFRGTTSVIDLSALVEGRAEFLRASAGQPLMTSVDHNVAIRGDAALLERVIDNLVGNAWKYAPGSPVTITVRGNGDGAVLEVSDHGRGIAPQERDRIFDRFFRGSAAAGTDGLGLGLSLVGEVARWHAGAVAVGDAPGGGALFRLSFPA